jgi:hypothetical protein
VIGHFQDFSAGERMGLILVAVKPNATRTFRVPAIECTLSIAAKPPAERLADYFKPKMIDFCCQSGFAEAKRNRNRGR